MDNQNKHSLFQDGSIRDFLAKQVGCHYEGEREALERGVRRLQEELSRMTEELEKAKQGDAVLSLIKKSGWEIFDVSGEISDYHKDTYFPFIGTEEEKKKVGL